MSEQFGYLGHRVDGTRRAIGTIQRLIRRAEATRAAQTVTGAALRGGESTTDVDSDCSSICDGDATDEDISWTRVYGEAGSVERQSLQSDGAKHDEEGGGPLPRRQNYEAQWWREAARLVAPTNRRTRAVVILDNNGYTGEAIPHVHGTDYQPID